MQWSNLISSWESLSLSSRRKWRRKTSCFVFGALLVWTNLIGMSSHRGKQMPVASYKWHVRLRIYKWIPESSPSHLLKQRIQVHDFLLYWYTAENSLWMLIDWVYLKKKKNNIYMAHVWEGKVSKRDGRSLSQVRSVLWARKSQKKRKQRGKGVSPWSTSFYLLHLLKDIYSNAFRGKTPYLSANNPFLHNPLFQTETWQHERKKENESILFLKWNILMN